MNKRMLSFLAVSLVMIPGYSFTRHGGAIAGGILGGLALGGIVGSAVADRHGYYDPYYSGGYYDPYYSDGYSYGEPRYYRQRDTYRDGRDLDRERDENARLREDIEEQREQKAELKAEVKELKK